SSSRETSEIPELPTGFCGSLANIRDFGDCSAREGEPRPPFWDLLLGVAAAHLVQRQETVIDFQDQSTQGGGIDSAAVAAPAVFGIPTATVRAVRPLFTHQQIAEGFVPLLPGVAAVLKHRQRSVIPIIKVETF